MRHMKAIIVMSERGLLLIIKEIVRVTKTLAYHYI